MKYSAREYSNEALIPVNKKLSLLRDVAESKNYWKQLVLKKSEFLSDEMTGFLNKEIDRLSDKDDWEVGDFPITRESTQAFMRLLIDLNPEFLPGITCDYEGHLIMYWRRGIDVARFKIYSRSWVRWYVTIKEGKEEIRLFQCGTLNKTIKELKNLELFHNKFLKM